MSYPSYEEWKSKQVSSDKYTRPGPLEKFQKKIFQVGGLAGTLFMLSIAVKEGCDQQIINSIRGDIIQTSQQVASIDAMCKQNTQAISTLQGKVENAVVFGDRLKETFVEKKVYELQLSSLDAKILDEESVREMVQEELARTSTPNYHDNPENGIQLDVECREYQWDMPYTGAEVFRRIPEIQYLLYCDKDENTIKVYEHIGSEVSLKYECPASFGTNTGQKQFAGDHRTPELICGISQRQAFRDRSKFGVGMYELDLENSTYDGSGGGILLCGTDDQYRIQSIEQGRDCSSGGVIVKNQDWLSIDGIIRNDLKYTAVVVEHDIRPLL
ncbi:MAG: hypothetical protein KKG59_00860 [Nanoarchaeota archaeon]|nr:hypothetical protein [Nanoarchaeota archaeon]